jgi:hypothetical protein
MSAHPLPLRRIDYQAGGGISLQPAPPLRPMAIIIIRRLIMIQRELRSPRQPIQQRRQELLRILLPLPVHARTDQPRLLLRLRRLLLLLLLLPLALLPTRRPLRAALVHTECRSKRAPQLQQLRGAWVQLFIAHRRRRRRRRRRTPITSEAAQHARQPMRRSATGAGGDNGIAKL